MWHVTYHPRSWKKKRRIERYDTKEEAEQAVKDIIAHNKKMHPNLPIADYKIVRAKGGKRY